MSELTLPASSASELWHLTRGELLERALFHGTGERLTGPIRGGGYDRVLWTAHNPAIAQTYLPSAGVKVSYQRPTEWEMKEPVAPRYDEHDLLLRIAAQMGYTFTPLARSANGRIESWSWGEKGSPKQADILEYITRTLGYELDESGRCKLSLASKIDQDMGDDVVPDTIQPAAWRRKGQLVVLLPKENLRVLDLAAGHEPDLTEVQYHNLEGFRKAERQGYDAVRIHDFAQSPSQGNVPHLSIGLLPRGIQQCREIRLPAVHHDWAVTWEAETPEFVQGHRSAVQTALESGQVVRPEVLAAYADIPRGQKERRRL